MSTSEKIASAIGTAPDVLVEYFDSCPLRNRPESRICCLPLSEALNYTQHVIGLAVGDHFGLFVLDDADDSNPFCFISRGPCSGGVLHLSHDGDTRISHRSLDSFLRALDALPNGADIDELPFDDDLEFDTVSTIQNILASQSDPDVLLPIYLPVSRSIPLATKVALASSEDFYIREAFAEWLLNHGARADLRFASRLVGDIMPQVSRPARQALDRLRIS